MIIPPLAALIAWIPLCLIAYRLLPVRIAILINFIGGWAVLPVANYPRTDALFPYWFTGSSLESDYFITKATIIGFTALLGLFIFDRPSLKRFRLTVWDLAMGMWLIAPFLSGIANPDSGAEAWVGECYQLLAWGSPYLIGRLYFTDTQSLRLVAKAFVIGGLAYIPFCIFEFIIGPHMYEWVYGYLPFQWNGAKRFIGFRPIVFLENGNQLGIWMATASLIALWLWRRRTAQSILGIPIPIVAASLFVVTILCQSTGAIILLLALTPFVFVDPRHLSRSYSIALIVCILAFAAFRLSDIASWQDLVKENPAVHSLDRYLRHIGKGSLGWRLREDDSHIETALQEPILGYGQWNWWDNGYQRPWSLWLLVFGMYGSVGLISLETLLLIPVLRAVWFPLARSDIGYTNMRHTLSAAILLSAIDSLLNWSILLPLMLVIGGMTIWSGSDAKLETEYQRRRAAAGTRIWKGSQNTRR
ncbi:hypothetical protein ACFPT7_06375 [Acidicapsa dinghuensis]|uniref:O-antigen ligase domain-containing protein n=1 Tax=Acidicapsa dinghuensis TaxID=2218256 RepID=A0ABW1EF66_9BACT|nr:hypothetical protein [Acidicapsa dinghuensis]